MTSCITIANEKSNGKFYYDPISCEEIDISDTRNVMAVSQSNNSVMFFQKLTLLRSWRSFGMPLNPYNRQPLSDKEKSILEKFAAKYDLKLCFNEQNTIVPRPCTYGEVIVHLAKTDKELIMEHDIVFDDDSRESVYDIGLDKLVRTRRNSLRLCEGDVLTPEKKRILEAHLESYDGGFPHMFLSELRGEQSNGSSLAEMLRNMFGANATIHNVRHPSAMITYGALSPSLNNQIFQPINLMNTLATRRSDDDEIGITQLQSLVYNYIDDPLDEDGLMYILDQLEEQGIRMLTLDLDCNYHSYIHLPFIDQLVQINIRSRRYQQRHIDLVSFYIRQCIAARITPSTDRSDIPNRIIRDIMSNTFDL